MQQAKQFLLGAAAFVAVVLGCATAKNTVKKNTPADPTWARIDSLDRIGQYAGALTLVDKVLEQARAANDRDTEFKAWMYKARMEAYTGVERKATLARLEQRTAELDARPSGGMPLKQLLHSVTGGLYWRLYQDMRWQVLQRTNGAGDPQDPDTWDQATFMRKVIAEHRAAVTPEDSLAAIPVGDMGRLLLWSDGERTGTLDGKKGDRSRQEAMKLRPTVFDVLAHRALVVFGNSETRLAEPAWRFRLDDPRLFALFDAFTMRDLGHRDSTAWEWQAMRLYQRLEHLHLRDNDPDALVDVTMQRLAFVRERSTLADKDSLYLDALTTLRTRLTKNTCWSEVTTAMAQWHAGQAQQYQRLAGDAWKTERRTAVDLCREAQARFPGSFGARNAAALMAQLQAPALGLQAEQAVAPDQAFRVNVEHTNLTHLWLRVVKRTDVGTRGRYPDEDQLKRLLKLVPLRSWDVALPDDGDLNAHLTDVPVDGLPLGAYYLIASAVPDFKAGSGNILFAPVSVTRLSLAQRGLPRAAGIAVLDRESGAPVSGAKAERYVQRYTDRSWKDVLAGSATTDADGMAQVAVPEEQGGQHRWVITKDNDRLYAEDSYYWRRGDEQATVDTLRTFLFTDRAIYRPGQPVLFKGIVTVKRGGTTVTKAGHGTRVVFRDVNGQVVDSLQVTTDAFGSFHGTFTAPQGALTGEMTLQEEHGMRGIRVEEYKRPTFEVVFDPVRSSPKLEQRAEVTGVARSYAGVPLDGAQVRWTVTRQARLPWWCGTYWRSIFPPGRPTEIASGTAVTAADGTFTIGFLAQADRSIARAADPTFTYTVQASATDVNGESQSSETSLSVGYRSIDLTLDVGEGLDRQGADSVSVQVRNLNGQPLDLPMDVRISRLTPPAVPLRTRVGDRPDRHVLSAEEHARRFPADPYADEDDPLTWAKAATVLERTAWTAGGRALRLAGLRDWDVGMYLVEASAKDPDGQPVAVRKVVAVYDATVRNTGFVGEAVHVEPVTPTVEPGGKAVVLVSTRLPEAHVLMEVERAGTVAVRRWFTLQPGQQRVELPVLEEDRGGLAVHFLSVERGREHRRTVAIDVPWSNKDLRVEWMTFRDKLLPGAKEEWRLRITGPQGEKVAAQLLAGMYDASLDHFVPHGWDLDVWPARSAELGWERVEPFGLANNAQLWADQALPGDTAHVYPLLNTFGADDTYVHFGAPYADRMVVAEGMFQARGVVLSAPMEATARLANGGGAEELGDGAREKAEAVPPPPPGEASAPPAAGGPQPVRTDFRETAFFFPDLLTDAEGAVVLTFTLPDALTRWKLLGLGHTTDLKLARFTKEAVAKKPLMVVPNLPRFLREGDRITLTTRIDVLPDADLGPEGTPGPAKGRRAKKAAQAPATDRQGTATLELFDPLTNAPLNSAFGLTQNARSFAAAPGKSATAEWSVTVPPDVGVVAVRVTARAGTFADGEEKPLPVLTDRVLITESLPLPISGAGTKTFTLAKLKDNTSTTLRNRSLKLEFTPNPAWYAVQALPYLMEYPHECAEQVFSRFYANSLASSIVARRPAIKQVFEQWKQAGPEAFASALEKNSELKSIVLAETPWVLDAASERDRKGRIALLFDMQRMGGEQTTALKKLRDMQLRNGSWPWFSGMQPSRWITQHIVAGLGHLERLDAADLRPDGQTQAMLHNAVRWLDAEVDQEYARMRRERKKEDLDTYRPDYGAVHYLYARSFFPRWPITGGTSTAVEFYKRRLAATWLEFGLQEQAMIALALDRLGDKATPPLILRSLKERATQSEELGLYWKGFVPGMAWNSFPTETHALMIEAFHEVAKDEAAVRQLRLYLLKLKQTTDWKTTKATAEACYALLLTGDDWLAVTDAPAITVGGQKVTGVKPEAGTGYFEKTWPANEVKPAMGEVTVTSTTDRVAWGALHWQYLEQMDRVTPHESPFRLRKQVFLKRPTDQGAQLAALEPGTALKAGDEITVRIELRTDRALDYVHMKDLRAAGLEPTEALSGYRYQGGLGYYQSIRDANMDFFFDRILPGTYVFEYSLRVTHKGDFSNGVTTAMCMYAPEFSSHSEGVRIVVPE